MTEFKEYIDHGEPAQKERLMCGKRQSDFMLWMD